MNLKRYLFLLLSVIVISCSTDDFVPTEIPLKLEAGVVITFDDDYVNEWHEVNSILEPYDWKATFFVIKFNHLSQEKIQKLKDLKNLGHEIGGHGLNHLNATDFIAENGPNQYLTKEINPMISLMSESNLQPTSFAYPYGARNASTDVLLLNQFKILRGTCYGNQNPAAQNCFYNKNRLVLGLGIDKNYAHFSIPYFLSILEYAKQNNKIVVFYAHKPVLRFQNNYETEYETLIEICKFVQNNNMKFYKISELKNLEGAI